jgi:hypothetical protein
VRLLAVFATTAGALAAPALAHAAAPPPIARPNPVTYPIRLDYTGPLVGTDGKTASLAPLQQGVIMAATVDAASLKYEKPDDLGGFIPATVGRFPLAGGGHDVLSPGRHATQIPLFAVAGGGAIDSFTFTGTPPSGPTPPPDNGNTGITPPPPPSPGNIPPPANQGFGGGRGGGGGGGGTTTTTTTTTTTHSHPPPPPTTTTTTTTTQQPPPPTMTTTQAPPTTTTTGGGGGGGGGGSGCSGGTCAAGSCGSAGLSVDSSLPGCTLSITNASPGDSVTEMFTLQNTSGSPYTLSFKAQGANNNHLWQDLQMDVYDPSGGAPTPPLPSLTSWLGFHALTTLNSGQTVTYVVELYLPTTAGNADQGRSAVVDFIWSAA